MVLSIKNYAVLICLITLLLPTSLLAETLTIPGTGDGVSVLSAVAAAFTRQNPGNVVNVPESIGSSGGIKAAGKGDAVLARVARGLKQKEDQYGLTYRPFATVPAVFFTSMDIPIDYLSSQQICDIYSGKINNWEQVGGPDLPIMVIRREESDSTLAVLRASFPGFDQVKIADNAMLANSTPEIFSMINQKNHAIGFGPYDVAKNSPVRIIKVDGRAPTFSDYPSVTILAFVYQKKKLTPIATKFLEFATSKEANLAIIVAGGIPIK